MGTGDEQKVNEKKKSLSISKSNINISNILIESSAVKKSKISSENLNTEGKSFVKSIKDKSICDEETKVVEESSKCRSEIEEISENKYVLINKDKAECIYKTQILGEQNIEENLMDIKNNDIKAVEKIESQAKNMEVTNIIENRNTINKLQTKNSDISQNNIKVNVLYEQKKNISSENKLEFGSYHVPEDNGARDNTKDMTESLSRDEVPKAKSKYVKDEKCKKENIRVDMLEQNSKIKNINNSSEVVEKTDVIQKNDSNDINSDEIANGKNYSEKLKVVPLEIKSNTKNYKKI